MKKLIYTILFTLIIHSFSVYAQMTQSDIDNFPINNPGVTELHDLLISGDVNNLNGLKQITSVIGNVSLQSGSLYNYPLSDITGLINLKNIGGSLSIMDVPNLTVADDFFNLATVGGSVNIGGLMPGGFFAFNSLGSIGGTLQIANSTIVHMNAFAHLSTIGANLYIGSNSIMGSIGGLGMLTTIGNEMTIYDNPNLVNLPILPYLVTQNQSIQIQNCNSLINLSGLDNLESVKNLNVLGNSSLENVTGLGHLKIIENLNLTDNTKLNSIEALINLNNLNGIIIRNSKLNSLHGLDNIFAENVNGNIYMDNNPNLSFCNIPFICNFISIGGSNRLYVHDNATNCNTVTEINDNCKLLSLNTDKIEEKLLSYPNPVSEVINIEGKNNSCIEKIVITDLTGKIILEQTQNTNQINVQNLANGIYILEAVSGTEKWHTKFIKK